MSPVLRKLRYKPGMRVAVLGAPAGFEAELAAAQEITRAGRLRRNLDLVQVFLTRQHQLRRDLARLRESLGPEGILWICYPKARGLGTDLDRDVIRSTVARAGLEAVAIVAVDEVWSALRVERDGGASTPPR